MTASSVEIDYTLLIHVQSNPLICIQQMSEHIIHLYGVFNNTINEIPTRGDNAGCSYNMILKTSIVHGIKKFLIGIIYILIFIYEKKN
jgi:hypothetical protein